MADRVSAAAQAAARINAILAAKGKLHKPPSPPPAPTEFTHSKEIEINDVPNPHRFSLTKTSFQEELLKDHEASIAVRGRFFGPEEKEALLKQHPDLTKLNNNDRPLYLVVQAKTALDLDRVVGRITVIIQEAVLKRGQPPQMPTAQPLLLPPSTRPMHYSQQKVFVGIEPEDGFDVKEKLLGPGGTYIAHIVRETNARLHLRGRGSGYIEPTSGKEAFEQLYIHASHSTQEGLNRAVQLCNDLVANVRQQYEEFKRAQAYVPPPIPPPYAAYGVPLAPPAPYGMMPPPVPPPGVPPPYMAMPGVMQPPMGPPPPYAFVPPPAPETQAPVSQAPPSQPNADEQKEADSEKASNSKKRKFVEKVPSPPRKFVERPPSPPSPPRARFRERSPRAKRFVERPPAAAAAPKRQRAEDEDGRNGAQPLTNGASADDGFKMPALPVKKKSKPQPQPEPAVASAASSLVDYGDDSDAESD